MTFEEMYPDTPILEMRDVYLPVQPYFGWDQVLKSREAKQCLQCGRICTWVEINFQAYLCSQECVESLNEEFFEACRKIGPIDPSDAFS